jgi:hypothetical protein
MKPVAPVIATRAPEPDCPSVNIAAFVHIPLRASSRSGKVSPFRAGEKTEIKGADRSRLSCHSLQPISLSGACGGGGLA